MIYLHVRRKAASSIPAGELGARQQFASRRSWGSGSAPAFPAGFFLFFYFLWAMNWAGLQAAPFHQGGYMDEYLQYNYS